MNLGVNIDHVATIREARRINEPDPLEAAFIAVSAGANQITLHLREDRRHIDEFDLERIIASCKIPVNVECSINQEIASKVSSLKPQRVTLVPEKREEVTTEGGLNLVNTKNLKGVIEQFRQNDIEVSLFIDPSLEALELSKTLGANAVEFHTGSYANLYAARYGNINRSKHKVYENLSRNELDSALKKALKELKKCAKEAEGLGLFVAAGHGLNYQNVTEIAKIEHIKELNIGHSIIARAVFVGLERAVKEMRELIV